VKGKQLTHVPKYVKAEAEEQAAYIAERKKAKEQAKGGYANHTEKVKSVEGSSGAASSSEAPATSTETLLVECAVCEKQLPWAVLSQNDGVCAECSTPAASGIRNSEEVAMAGQDLMVECSQCQQVCSWSLLQLGDGACPKCFQERQLSEERPASSYSSGATGVVDSATFLQGQAVLSEQASDIQIDAADPVVLAGGGWRSRRRP